MEGDTKFEDFIGKHIDDFKVINSTLKHRDDLNKYYLFSEAGYKFYGKTYKNATITTDNKNIIKDITIYISGIVDSGFYDAFKRNYGDPSEILVVDTSEVVSEKKFEGEMGGTVKEENFTFREGRFEDKPQYLIWNKKDYGIKIFLRHDIKMSEIKFALPQG